MSTSDAIFVAGLTRMFNKLKKFGGATSLRASRTPFQPVHANNFRVLFPDALNPLKFSGWYMQFLAYLFAEDQESRFLSLDDGSQNLCNGERVNRDRSDVHVNGAVSAHGQRRPQRLSALSGTDGNGDDLSCTAILAYAEGLLQSNLAEGVHRHLHVTRLHPALIGGNVWYMSLLSRTATQD